MEFYQMFMVIVIILLLASLWKNHKDIKKMKKMQRDLEDDVIEFRNGKPILVKKGRHNECN